MSSPAPLPEHSPGRITVKPLAIHLGAEISGVDISKPLDQQTIAEIRRAILEWKVVFFRDQQLDHRSQIAFARQFGELTPAHVVFGGNSEFPEIYPIAKFRTANSKREAQVIRPWTGWHADITAAHNPPWASMLRGDVVPPYGGDTLWTNLAAAYRALSPIMRDLVETLRGIHRFQPTSGAKDYDNAVRQRPLETEHPLVRVHPETGEKSLYVSPSFLKEIVGLTPQESFHLLEMLWEHSVRPEFTVRFKWEPGSVAFWDNRTTAHLAPRDIFDSDFDRQFYRVTLQGDVPFGVDGTPSKSLSGDPIRAL